MSFGRVVKRNGGAALRLIASLTWLVTWSALTVVGVVPNEYAVWVPLAAMSVPTILLVVAELRHIQGRSDISIGDPELVATYVINPPQGGAQINVVKGFRVAIHNAGAPVEITPRLHIEPDPSAHPRTRVLHREQDWLTAHGTEYAEWTVLAKDDSRWFELVSIADEGRGPRVFVHNALAIGTVEWLDLTGSYDLVVEVIGGNETHQSKRFLMTVEPPAGVLTIVPGGKATSS